MKYLIVITSLFTLLGCKNNATGLQVTPIYTEPQRITKENPGTGKIYTYTTRKTVTERLNPMILMLSKNTEILQFRIQGNINSGGHMIRQVKKIRFEKGEQNGNTMTLKYYVEIRKIPGKENAGIQGYNYSKDEIYNIPDIIKIIKVELYEDRINDTLNTKPKCIAQQTFKI